MSNIELEHRALLSKEQYNSLLSKLNKIANDLGEDDKNVYFFIFPDKLLKVVNNISKNSAKIVLKLNKIGLGSDFEEIEIPIEPKDVEKSVHMFKSIGFNELQESFQKRQNYLYKGVELAIKYSDNWGYHMELEIILDNKNKIEKANKKIFAVAGELGLKILTNQELKDFTRKIDSAYREKKSFKRQK